MSFQLSSGIDENKIFLVNSSELEGRLDPFYYIPKLVELDKKIKSKAKQCLKDFSIFKASGSTPNKNDEGYYSDQENGVPFIRVQNLSVTGKLHQDDLVYIAKNTHEGLLKRSQIKEGDLLIKITGVGRMAVASVTPSNFIGNINQHIVVIRTNSREISENIAAFLNLDIVEKIATKRATGGTRPALDYPALFSIPIMNDRKIYTNIQKAVDIKKQKETEAQRLLDSIDNYLLRELGIELSEQQENTLQSRIFTRQFSEMSGGRFDPFVHSLNKQDKTGKYTFHQLKEITKIQKGNSITSNNVIDGNIPVVAGGQTSPYSHNIANSNGNVITISASGAYAGYVWYHEKPIFASDCTMISVKNPAKLNSKYLFEYLKTEQQSIYNLQQGSGQPHVYPSDLEKIKIPVPSLKKQTEIANHITEIRNQAKRLQQQAKTELEQAKQAVEKMILGEA